jgi:hypothetical protein
MAFNPKSTRPPADPCRRIAEIKAGIQAIDHVCAGTLLKRTKKCGSPACQCAIDRARRHGPYYEWSRLLRGRFARRSLPPGQAERIKKAIANRRRVLMLLRDWERETLRIVEAENSSVPV